MRKEDYQKEKPKDTDDKYRDTIDTDTIGPPDRNKEDYDYLTVLSEFKGEYGSRGQYFLNEGQYHAAINYFDEDLEKYPKSVYYMFGKGLALAKLGKHKEAIPYYDKIIETSNKYLIKYYPTFGDLYEITLTVLYEKWRSLRILGNRKEATKALDEIRELSKLDTSVDKNGTSYYGYENFWLHRAKACVSKGHIASGLEDLEKSVIIFKLAHSRSEWQSFEDQIKYEKDFQSIINDESFKLVINKIPDLYDIFPTGTNKGDYDDVIFWLNQAKDSIKKGDIDDGLKNLKLTIERYKKLINSEVYIFINKIKQDKDFQAIVNNEVIMKELSKSVQ